MAKSGLYIHIPFCARKCPYCDFYSVPLEWGTARQYVSAVINQIQTADKSEVDTVYFGGGTPSLLNAKDIYLIIDAANEHFSLDRSSEITLEMNPATCSEAKLRDLRSAGINRLSVGVQSTDDAVLKKIGRLHNRAEALYTLELAHRCGFDNISADVMLALPDESEKSLLCTINDLCSLPITHISAYLLKIMEGTPFSHSLPGYVPDDDRQADLYLMSCELLDRLGFAQYEISNFAKEPQFKSRHNLKYWNCEPYFGLGAAAHSSVGEKLFSFSRNIDKYLSVFCDSLKPEHGFCDYLDYETSLEARDYIMLRLRTVDGLDLCELDRRFNFSFDRRKHELIDSFVREGFVLRSGSVISLTRRGMLVSNSVISELI
ncbi:MAG: radical SAM family heme chaperone HemW [Oscillospiraceae bacterium]